MLGGGNAKRLKKLPPKTYLGSNANAITVPFVFGRNALEPKSDRFLYRILG